MFCQMFTNMADNMGPTREGYVTRLVYVFSMCRRLVSQFYVVILLSFISYHVLAMPFNTFSIGHRYVTVTVTYVSV